MPHVHPDAFRQPCLTPELKEAQASDVAARDTYGVAWRAETEKGRGPRVWRLIGDSQRCIDELWEGLPKHLQHEVLGADMAAEKRRRLLDTDPGLSSSDSVALLENVRAEMLLRELFLRDAWHRENEQKADMQPRSAA